MRLFWMALIMVAFGFTGIISGCEDDNSNENNKTEKKDTEDTESEAIVDTESEDETSDTASEEASGDVTTDTSNDEEAEEDMVTVKLQIPDDFDGTPVTLSGVFYSTTSESPMPDEFGTMISSPEIFPGETFEYTTGQSGLEGDYYFSLVLYCEGGTGQFPVAGVDWIAGSEEPITLGPGTGTVDAGEYGLFLAE